MLFGSFRTITPRMGRRQIGPFVGEVGPCVNGLNVVRLERIRRRSRGEVVGGRVLGIATKDTPPAPSVGTLAVVPKAVTQLTPAVTGADSGGTFSVARKRCCLAPIWAVRGSECPVSLHNRGTTLRIIPNAGGQQPGSTPPPSSSRATVVLIFAGACGTVSGYLAYEWRTGAEVFTAVVASYTPR
jgi:hypothetical protein